MTNYKVLLRRKLLNDIYERMTDEEKHLFIQSMMQSNSDAVMQKLDTIERQVERNKYSFATDLLANVSGNFVADGLIWIGSRLFKRL